MLNWYCYRLPDTSVIKAGWSTDILNGFHHGGFIVAPFDNSQRNLFTIPADNVISFESVEELDNFLHTPTDSYFFNIAEGYDCNFPIPDAGTTKESHHAEVEKFITYHRTIGQGKTIAARVKKIQQSVNIENFFIKLCKAYPSACVFSFGSEKTGTWIGATPELLLSHCSGKFTTMALAGTRIAGSICEWDSKNMNEQQMVVDYIMKTLTQQGLTVIPGDKYSKYAGPVEHLCTNITAISSDSRSQSTQIFGRIAQALSPTPALCGSDKAISMKLISENESFERGYYGGYFGETDNYGCGTLFVNLRSARITGNSICLFAGGGITIESDPADEWLETERKLLTLLKYL